MKTSRHQLEGGEKTYDPSENVKALQEASNKRQDDLRLQNEKFLFAEVKHVKELAKLLAKHGKENAELRSVYEEKIALSEKGRIDAIRAVDVNAVALANEKQSAAAVILANEVTKSADTLRTLVATTASAAEAQQRQLSEQINKRLTDLEKALNESRGRGLVADPMMEKLFEKIDSMNGTRREGISSVWVAVIGVFGILGTISAIIFGIMAFT